MRNKRKNKNVNVNIPPVATAPSQLVNIKPLPASQPTQAVPATTSSPTKPRTVNDDLKEIFQKANIDPTLLKQQVLARASFPKQWIDDLASINTPTSLSIARLLEYHNIVTENYKTNTNLTQNLRSILASHPLLGIPAQTLDQEYKILAQCTAELRAIGVRTTVNDKVRIKTAHRLPPIDSPFEPEDDKSASLLQSSLKDALMFRPGPSEVLGIHQFSTAELTITRKQDVATIMFMANKTILPQIAHISWTKTAASVATITEISDTYQASFKEDFSDFAALVNAELNPPRVVGEIVLPPECQLPRWAKEQDCSAYKLGLAEFKIAIEPSIAINEIEEIFGLGRLIPPASIIPQEGV